MNIKKLCLVGYGFSEFDKRIVKFFHKELRKIIDTSLVILESEKGIIKCNTEQINQFLLSDAILVYGSAGLFLMHEIISDLKLTKPTFVIVDDFLAETGVRALNFMRSDSAGEKKLTDYLSEKINHELVNYFFFDRGQAYYLSKLNILKKEVWYIHFSCWFGSENTENYDDQDIDISFIGNISPVLFFSKYQDLFLKCFLDKLNDFQKPAFEIFLNNVSSMNNISPENPIFWSLYRYIIYHGLLSIL